MHSGKITITEQGWQDRQQKQQMKETIERLQPGDYYYEIGSWQDARSEPLSRFFHGPVIDAFIAGMQEKGYLKEEAKEKLKLMAKDYFKRKAGPEYAYYNPLLKDWVRQPKSFARSNSPQTISHEELVQMLMELEVLFSALDIPWPDSDDYKKAKHKTGEST